MPARYKLRRLGSQANLQYDYSNSLLHACFYSCGFDYGFSCDCGCSIRKVRDVCCFAREYIGFNCFFCKIFGYINFILNLFILSCRYCLCLSFRSFCCRFVLTSAQALFPVWIQLHLFSISDLRGFRCFVILDFICYSRLFVVIVFRLFQPYS